MKENENLRIAYLKNKSDFSSKAVEGCNYAKVEVGKWYQFKGGNNFSDYGKVVKINKNGTCLVEKYFQISDSKASIMNDRWFFHLPVAIK